MCGAYNCITVITSSTFPQPFQLSQTHFLTFLVICPVKITCCDSGKLLLREFLRGVQKSVIMAAGEGMLCLLARARC